MYCLDSSESRTNHGTHIPVKTQNLKPSFWYEWHRCHLDHRHHHPDWRARTCNCAYREIPCHDSQGWHTCAHSYLQDDRVLILIVVTWLCQCVKSMEELCMWESIRTGRWPPKSKRKPERQIPVPRENRHLAGQPEANLSMANSIQETIRTKITCQIVHLPKFPCYQWQTLSQFPCLPY